ncbi:MAG: YybS family protein [Solirubrobacterales bacterium]
MQNRNYNTKAIVEAGLISSILAVLMILTIYVPLFSIVGAFILPIPVTILYIRHNLKITLASVITCTLITSMIFNPTYTIPVLLVMGSQGAALGYCIKNKKSTWFTLTLLAVVSIVASIMDIAIYISFTSQGSFMTFVNNQVNSTKSSMASIIQMYKNSGVSEAQLQQLNSSMDILTPEYFIQMIPPILVIIGLVSAWINYSITRAILKKLRYDVPAVSPFSTLYLNNRIGTVILVLMITGILLDKSNVYIGKYISTSFQIIFQMVLIADGAALAVYWLKNKLKLSRLVTVLIIILTVTSIEISMIYIFAGLMDMIFDFRKLDPFRIKKAQ